MRICVVEDSTRWGGSQKWLRDFIKMLVKTGNQVSLIAPHRSWIFSEVKDDCQNFALYDYQEIAQSKFIERYIESWANCIKGVDLLFATVYDKRGIFQNIDFCVKSIVDYGNNIPVVIRSGTISKTRSKDDYLPNEIIVHKIIASSNQTLRFLVDYLKIEPNKIRVIPQGVDLSYFKPDKNCKEKLREKYGIQVDKKVIGILGYFEERKGHIFFLNAYRNLLNGESKNLHLVLIGDGPFEKNIMDLIREENLAQHVSILPYTDSILEIYQLLDILMLPSHYNEGVPNVIMEGMSMRVPVIASDLPGVVELIADGVTGFTFRSSNLKDCIEKVSYVLSLDEEKMQLVNDNAYSLIHTKYNREILLQEYLTFLRNLSSLNKPNNYGN